MRRFAIVLAVLAGLALSLVVIGQGYSQEDTGYGYGYGDPGNWPGSCCALASAYTSTDDEELDLIRDFRDQYLVTNPIGRGVVVLYYDVISPPLAHFINDHPTFSWDRTQFAGKMPRICQKSLKCFLGKQVDKVGIREHRSKPRAFT